MKITSIGVNNVNPYNKQQQKLKSVSGHSPFADKIEISTAAKEMQGSSTYSAERAEKVEKLKAEIESGEYKVDARKVAADMLKYYRY
ncbi:flagellar biosynthesis anti-sigma factor FlgM [Ureibacillus massiliensis 4400831 = CIP 108448 = CCUG 49529]|uniref:Negative regulator of flagellin synthesis n=1 Tax=Ureibacillus massiliensis 4400831 = CIP 108448 = CCUG 49529 TaxID=1211035 RepID=A0A0A3J2X7_9BACL|nr:flagellar biosynthesis anti-sigma factor FlgM [Ureibacillus massiliensis]KGR90080.1 flagellar biosynthesis anti-sigma factor FlgM [Ureibacillus massiliensis 4400831 = CIP 108448 = CCUG 49529]